MSAWKKLKERIAVLLIALLREPVAILGTLVAVVGYVLIELGDSAPRWLAILYGVLSLLATRFVRSKVTPVADPRLPEPTVIPGFEPPGE